MMIRFRPEVANDIIEAFDYYESKRTGLGAEFLQEYQRALEIVVERPFSIAIARHGYRPCQLKRFPYLIHYDVTDNVVLIVALLAACRGDGWAAERE
jgi:ParE toxin of type II toxin-antitoxin system, parDE